MAAVYDDILDDVVTDIQGLSLSGIADANIVKRKVPAKLKNDKDIAALPCVLVAPFGSPTVEAYSNENDQIVYPVLVVTIAPGNQDQSTNDTRQTEWHQKIRRQFRPTGGGVTISEAGAALFECTVAPRNTYDLPSWFDNYDAGDTLLRFRVKEPRTNA